MRRSTGAVAIGFTLGYFGNNYSDLYVNNNGNVTFGAAMAAFTPTALSGLAAPTLAPFWADASDSATDIAEKVGTAINGTGKFAAVVSGTDVKITAIKDGRGWQKLTYANVGGIWTPVLTGPTLKSRQVVNVVGTQVIVPPDE